jgi:uncharacterized iron-regulated membrane protein
MIAFIAALLSAILLLILSGLVLIHLAKRQTHNRVAIRASRSHRSRHHRVRR